MKNFDTIDELAEYIMEVMKGDNPFGKISDLFGHANVTLISSTQKYFEITGNFKTIITSLPKQRFFGKLKLNSYSTVLHMDLYTFDQNSDDVYTDDVYADMRFDLNYSDYEIVYSSSIKKIINDTGKSIYELDDVDWDILYFEATLS